MVMGNDTIIPKITLHKTIKIDLLAILLAKQSTDNMIFFLFNVKKLHQKCAIINIEKN